MSATRPSRRMPRHKSRRHLHRPPHRPVTIGHAGRGRTRAPRIWMNYGVTSTANSVGCSAADAIPADRAAGRLAASVYRRATMYTTLSPCDMCTGAILLYGISRVVNGLKLPPPELGSFSL